MSDNTYDILKQLFLADKSFSTTENTLNLPKIQKDVFNATDELIKLLMSDKTLKNQFFTEQNNTLIYNRDKLLDFISNKNFLANSYTKFSNKIGLAVGNRFLKQNTEVVLNFPFKDCVLEGGQTKDDKKQQELFFNETLAHEEIDRLFSPKVLSNAQRFNKDGATKATKFNRDENGLIKDNLIIKGNNLIALNTLKTQFQGKVKLIYIDPPYNTGNDSFNYNDNFNHSTWLTFMKNRLEVAKDLLSDDGVIFVQCDDNEQAYLKVLMDEVFGRDNFIANFIWKKKGTSTNVKGVQVSQLCELIACYAITSKTGIYSRITKSGDRSYAHKDELGKYRLTIIEKKNTGEYKRESMRFEIIGKKPRNGKRWQMGEIKARKLEDMNRFILDKGIVKQKIYDFEDTDSFSAQPTLFNDIGSTNEGDREIIKLSFDVEFNNPKPEKLLQKIIEISTKKGDIVLDYHLGSGTTCAVAHKMGRQYIGIEQMDYIEDIAVKRMQKVIGKTAKKDGELLKSVDFDNGGISKSVNWQGGGEFVYMELKQNTAELIAKITNAKTTDELLSIKNNLLQKNYTFVDYRLKMEFLKDKNSDEFKDFSKLEFSEQQRILISIFDKNQMYVNYSERDDDLFNISADEKMISENFYHKKL